MRKNKDSITLINTQMNLIARDKKTIMQVANYVGSSRKTIGKWYQEYLKKGGVSRKTHYPVNAYAPAFNNQIMKLYKNRIKRLEKRFSDKQIAGLWLPTIKYFKLVEELRCSTEHIRKLLTQNNYLYRRIKRKTKKAIKSNLKRQLLTSKDWNAAQQLKNQLKLANNHRLYHGKSGVAGFRIEVGGCHDHWFGTTKQCLYFAVDAFTGVILDLWIEKEETSIGYLNLLKGTLQKHGKPRELRSDKRNGLWQGKLADAIGNLGIIHSASTEPTYKPNVERAFQDAQNLLPNYLMDANINSITELQAKKEQVLVFLNDYLNRKMPDDNCFISTTADELANFVLITARRVVNDISHIVINNRKYAPFRN